MKVKELIAMLEKMAPEAPVVAADIYGEKVFIVTGAIGNGSGVCLTGETTE